MSSRSTIRRRGGSGYKKLPFLGPLSTPGWHSPHRSGGIPWPASIGGWEPRWQACHPCRSSQRWRVAYMTFLARARAHARYLASPLGVGSGRSWAPIHQIGGFIRSPIGRDQQTAKSKNKAKECARCVGFSLVRVVLSCGIMLIHGNTCRFNCPSYDSNGQFDATRFSATSSEAKGAAER